MNFYACVDIPIKQYAVAGVLSLPAPIHIGDRSINRSFIFNESVKGKYSYDIKKSFHLCRSSQTVSRLCCVLRRAFCARAITNKAGIGHQSLFVTSIFIE